MKGLLLLKTHEHYKQLWVDKLGACAVTIGSHIFYDLDKPYVEERIRKHERKHVEQYKKYGLLGFLMVYFFWYILGRLNGKNHWQAYYANPLEIEAKKAEKE